MGTAEGNAEDCKMAMWCLWLSWVVLDKIQRAVKRLCVCVNTSRLDVGCRVILLIWVMYLSLCRIAISYASGLFYSLPPPKKEVMFLVRSVCVFVCLSVGLLANLWTDFDEIFWRGRAWLKVQVIQFWWWSGSHFGSGSSKSEIRILRIGRGLCSLSASRWVYF